MAAVAVVEATTFSPWSREQIASELKRKTGFSLVAVSTNGEVAAWCCGFQTGIDAELLKITVSPLMQRLGLGEALLQKLCTFFAQQGVEQIFLEVRSENQAALNLYIKSGFLETGRRKNYYKEPADDAVILVRRLNNNKE